MKLLGLWSVLLVMLVLALQHNLAAAKETEETCNSWCFSPELLCSSCKKLGEFTEDAELLDECRKCCSQDKEAQEVERSPYAVLYYNELLLGMMPQLASFLENDAQLFVGLKLKGYQGRPATLHLKNSDKKTVSTIEVDKWSRDTLREYLSLRLIDSTGHKWK